MSVRHAFEKCVMVQPVNKSLMTLTRNIYVKRAKKPKHTNPHHKMRKVFDNRPIINKQRETYRVHNEAAIAMNLPWRIVGSTVLHRYPVVTPDKEPWEKEFSDLQERIGVAQREHYMSLVGGTPAQMICDTDPTYKDILQTMPFQPAPRVTIAATPTNILLYHDPTDETNDRRSVDRKLPRSLFLITKRNREEFAWQFPQGKIRDTEDSLRKVVERVIDRAVGRNRRYFISNAPIGHYCYAYPPAMQQQRQQYGAMIYFYRCQLIEGGINLETKLYTDYAWVTNEEVREYMDPDLADYLTYVLPTL